MSLLDAKAAILNSYSSPLYKQSEDFFFEEVENVFKDMSALDRNLTQNWATLYLRLYNAPKVIRKTVFESLADQKTLITKYTKLQYIIANQTSPLTTLEELAVRLLAAAEREST